MVAEETRLNTPPAMAFMLAGCAVLFLTGWFGAEGARVWLDSPRAEFGALLGQVSLVTGLVVIAVAWGRNYKWARRAWISQRQLWPYVLVLAAAQYIALSQVSSDPMGYTSRANISAWHAAWFTIVEGLVFTSALALGIAVRHVAGEMFLRILSLLISALAVVFVAGHESWNLMRGTETLVYGWPLANPNHSSLIFGVGVLVVSGLVSHRASSLRHLQRSPWREILQHKQFVIGVLQLGILCWAIVLLQSASVMLGTLGASVLLVLGDLYNELDWVVRRGVRWARNRIRTLVLLAMTLPVCLIVLLGTTGVYQGAVVRVTLWRDTLAMWWHAGPTGWATGRGLTSFVYTYPRFQSWDAGFPAMVLGPESEVLFWLAEAGLVGVGIVIAAAFRLHIVPLFSRNPTVMSRDWAARIGSWILLLIAMQSMVDNTLHTRAMVYLAALIWGFSLRSAVVQSPFPSNSPQTDGQVS